MLLGIATSLARARSGSRAEVSEKKIRGMVEELIDLRESLDYHILDPEGLPAITGSIEFEKPIPLPRTVHFAIYDRNLWVVLDTQKMSLKKLEFVDGGSYKVRATFEVCGVDGVDYEMKSSYYSTVEGLTLLYHDNVYRELMGGRAKVEGGELNDFLSFVDGAVRAVVQSGGHELVSPREMFRKYFDASGSGRYGIFYAKDWEAIIFITDYVGPHDEDYIGVVAKKNGVYIALFDLLQQPVDYVGIDYIKESKYRITASTLSKSPLAPTLIKLVREGVKYLNEYVELAKIVFLGAKAFAT